MTSKAQSHKKSEMSPKTASLKTEQEADTAVKTAVNAKTDHVQGEVLYVTAKQLSNCDSGQYMCGLDIHCVSNEASVNPEMM